MLSELASPSRGPSLWAAVFSGHVLFDSLSDVGLVWETPLLDNQIKMTYLISSLFFFSGA